MFKDRFLSSLFFVNLYLLILQVGLVYFGFTHLPNQIPVWLTNPWGEGQLAGRSWVILFPLSSVLFWFLNQKIYLKMLTVNERLAALGLSALTTLLLSVLTMAIFRISLMVSHLSFPWFLKPQVVFTLGLSFILSSLLTFPTLRLARKLGLLDNPEIHKHPAMLLTRSVSRAGSLPLFVSLIATTAIISGWDDKLTRIILAGSLALAIGLLDDKFDLNPYWRFAGQVVSALIVVSSGIQIHYINHPLGSGVLPLTNTIWHFTDRFSLQPISFLSAFFWIIWTMNMISWSNGVDGQFPLIVTVAALVIGILGLTDVNQFKTSTMAFAMAGAALGTLAFTWHPSRMLYGFGATAIGLVLAALSILNGTKIATALLVLLVPSLDAIFTVFRRLRQGRSPFWGDREHFHHKLLDLGFSQKQISLFYGGVGVLLGTLSIISSGRGKLLAIITAAGIFIFILSIINYLPSSRRDDFTEKN